MDWTQIAIAAVTVLGGALTAWLVAGRLAGNDRDLERSRWKRELYARLTREIGVMSRSSKGALTARPGDRLDALDRAMVLTDEIGMIAGDEMWERALDLLGAAQDELADDLGIPPRSTGEPMEELAGRHLALVEFQKAARADLA